MGPDGPVRVVGDLPKVAVDQVAQTAPSIALDLAIRARMAGLDVGAHRRQNEKNCKVPAQVCEFRT